MSKPYITNTEIAHHTFGAQTDEPSDYEGCTFSHCSFKDCDLSDWSFTECEFSECDWTGAKLINTGLRDASFSRCKMLGLHFEDCSPLLFDVRFQGCQLNVSSFYRVSMSKTVFRQCSMQEVDFTEADLSAAVFDESDLMSTTFEHTNLERADLRTAHNFSIDPEKNRITNARFALSGLPGLLSRHRIEVEW